MATEVVKLEAASSKGTTVIESRVSATADDITTRIAHLGFVNLTENFLNLRNLLEIARNGAMTEAESSLLFDIEVIFKDLAGQCTESVSLLQSFESTCEVAVEDASICYGYLESGLDKLALKAFEHLIRRSSDMEKKSTDLAEEFSSLSKDVDKVLRRAIEMLHHQTNEMTKLLEEKKEIQGNIEKLLDDLEDIKGVERAAEGVLQKGKDLLKEESGLFKKVFQFLNKVTVNIGYHVQVTTEPRRDADEIYQNAVQKIRAKAIKNIATARMNKGAILVKRKRLAKREAKVSNEIVTMEEVVGALRSCYCFLKSLNASMIQFSKFWKIIKDHCSNVAKCGLEEKATCQLAVVDCNRSIFLQSAGLDGSVKKFCGSWKFLEILCKVSREELQKEEKAVYDALKRLPDSSKAGVVAFK